MIAPRRLLATVLAGTLAAAATLALAPATPAEAKTERTVRWDLARVFPAAIRFLRVDEHVTIVEKDAEAGYVLFDLVDEGKTFHGALELIVIDQDDRPGVRLVLRLEDRPSYMELGMLDRLERKLRDDLGPPPRGDARPAKPAKPDAPADAPAP
ncbi:MAG: hypothetical protein H6709_18915 [Kofleriaceae bacterium]|nr:hypothetical protein [Myxococcales bacterium]MCB9564837.1 hypothetical protein [Kofleriaceae bacterium]MCB9574161.1 hypothetical protein [Kofleriaceae bacterium]